jgi:ATP synthase protein I
MRSYRRTGASNSGHGGPDRGEVDRGVNEEAVNRALGLSTGWAAFSYLISGMLAYGGIGWVVGHFTHIALLFPIGMMVGLAISVGYVIHRYGRQ